MITVIQNFENAEIDCDEGLIITEDGNYDLLTVLKRWEKMRNVSITFSAEVEEYEP